MRPIVLLCLIILLFSCRTAVQVVDMQPTSPTIKDNQTHYVFDNDTVRIAYHFWGDKGQFWFEIQNKLSVPIYIDWKKSNLLNNNIPYPYWDDNKQVNTLSVGKGYGASVIRSDGVAVSASVGGAVSSSVITAKERITFLSPGSIVSSRWQRVTREYFILAKDAKHTEVPNDAKPSKTTVVYSQPFADDNTPIRLTNFITLSFSEDFKDEIFVSNSFFASMIREMDAKHFWGKPINLDENSYFVYDPSSLSEKRFYIEVPQDYDYKSYWKLKN
jgi:hypothetical protein